MRPIDSVFCRTASLIWSAVNAGARVFHRRLSGRVLNLNAGMVISVGNLQAGGAGKTPLVARLARELCGEGLSVAILCRGYGGIWESGSGVIEPGSNAVDPGLTGDEAALLHALVPQAWIGVGADRFASFQGICEKLGARPDVAVLDDGFQHFRIARDVDLLAVTSHSAWNRVHRDFLRRSADAELLVWAKGEKMPPSARYAKGPVLRGRFVLDGPDPGWMDRGHWLVTGVGDAEETRRSFERAGFRIERHAVFRDHARYSREWIEEFLQQAGESHLRVVTTGKDAVKWRSLGISAMRFDEREPRLELSGEGEAAWREHRSQWIQRARGLDFRIGSP